MKRIVLSLLTIVVALATVAGATYGVFSSTASVTGNTFATGVLAIRVNGGSSIVGVSVNDAAPGTCMTNQFGVNNYGAPHFGGPSTLPVKELVISAANTGGDLNLYGTLTVVVEANRGWDTWMPVYNGSLSGLNQADLFGSRWNELIAGSTHDVRYTVCLPRDAGNELQGKSTTFDLVIDAYNPRRSL